MIIQSPGEVAFTLFGYNVYWYGIILACAVLVGVLYADSLCRKFKLPENFWIENSPITIFTGIVGARIYYCAVNYQYYFLNMPEIFDIRQGGLSIHGMIFFGIVLIFVLSKVKKISFLSMSDSAACALPLAQAIGRWGNFLNSEAFGIPTNGQWGLFIPIKNRPADYMNYELFHPAFLYESIADLVIFGILLLISRKNNSKSGTLTLIYLILYSLVRIIVESVRTDSTLSIGTLHIAQVISLAVITICTILLVIRYRN